MLLFTLLEGLEYTLTGKAENINITVPVTDSREASENSMFICINGTKRRGADYVCEAKSRGAAAFVAEEAITGYPTVIVKDARLAAAIIWNNYYMRPAENMRLFGITGTNGKTSTAAFLESILQAEGRKVGMIGTLGCSIDGTQAESRGTETSDIPAAMTTPDPKYLYSMLSQMKKEHVTDVVMEVSSHSILQKKTEPLLYEAAIFTNLSPEHLDCHKSMEEYFNVKARLIKDKCRKAIVNGDDPYGRRLDGVYASIKNASDIKTDQGTSYVLRHNGKEYGIQTAVGGAFTVYNTMLAAICALECGISDRAVTEGIKNVRCINGRMECIASRDKYGFSVYIDYAHTPAAIEAALSGFDRGEGRLTALFGCGGDRDREKRPKMGEMACKYADRVIITSDNPRSENRLDIIKDIISGISPEQRLRCAIIPSREEAICYAIETAREGERIILLGKGHETWETNENGKKPFCEREIVGNLLKRKYGR